MVALKKVFDAFQNATDAQRTFREIMFLQVCILTAPFFAALLLTVVCSDNSKRVGCLWFQSAKSGETLVYLTRQMQGPASAETRKKTLTCIRTIFMGL